MVKKKLSSVKINDNHSIYNLLGIRYGVKGALIVNRNDNV